MTKISRSMIVVLLVIGMFSIGSSQSFIDNSIAVGVDTTYGNSFFGGSSSLVDFNQDGYDDLTFSTDIGAHPHFYQNNGDGTFTKLPSFIPHTGLSHQVIWVDYDDDGDLDIYVTTDPEGSVPLDGQDRLYQNDGSLNFTEVTTPAGIIASDATTYAAGFGDIDHDGDLDLYAPRYSEATTNVFYINNGDGTYSDSSDDLGLTELMTLDFQPIFFDADGDGDLDIYTVVDRYVMQNRLYINDGTGYFGDSTDVSGAGISIDAMNGGIADYDNDGDLDIYVSNSQAGNVLLQNDGTGKFTDVSDFAGVRYGQVAWGGAWMDVDNDRDLDLYVCGIIDSYEGRNKLYKNLGNGTFEEYDMGGLPGDSLSSFSVAVGDIDKDGMVDLVVSSGANHQLRVWQNDITNANNWVGIKLKGTTSNSFGIGSWIEVYESGIKQVRFTHCGINYLGQNSLEEHFGLGDGTVIDSAIVRWPSGVVDKFLNLDVNLTYTFTEGACIASEGNANENGNNYIGGNNGDLTDPANWSWGITPTKDDDAYINYTGTGTMTLTIDETDQFSCRSLAIVGNIVFINNGTVSMNQTFYPSIFVDTDAQLENNGEIIINEPCVEAMKIKGSFIDHGLILISK